MLQELTMDEISQVSGGLTGVEEAFIGLAAVGLVLSGGGLVLAAAYGGVSVAGAVGLGVAGAATGFSALGLGLAVVYGGGPTTTLKKPN